MVLLATLVTEYVADLTDLQSGAKKAAELVKQFGNLKQPDVVAKSFTVAGQQAADMASKTASATAKMASGLSTVAQKADSATASEKKLGTTAEQASSSIGTKLVGALHGGVSGLIELADHATTAILNMGQLAQQGISLASDLLKPAAAAKEVESSLTIFDGSVEKARKEMQQLAQFASHTPFDTQSIDEMALKMQGVGISSNKVIPYLTALGDAMDAMGDTSAADLEGLVNSFNKIQSTGHLTGEVVQSFADRGINVWKILEQQTGKTQEELRKMVEKGAIPAADAMRYLTNGIEASPLYHGQMANDAEGVAGALSNLKANFNQALVSFGSPILDKLVPIFNNIGAAISSPAFQGFAGTVGKGIADVFGKIGEAASHVDFNALASTLERLGTTVGGPIVEHLRSMGQILLQVGQWAMQNVVPALEHAAPSFAKLSEAGDSIAKNVLPPLLNGLGQIVPPVLTLATNVATVVSNFVQWIGSTGILNVVMGILQFAINAVVFGVTLLTNIIGGIINFFTQTELGATLLKAALIALAIIALPLIIAGLVSMVSGLIAYTTATVAAGIANLIAWGPVILIILAIIVVIALVILAVTHWGDICKWFGNVFSAIGTWVHGIIVNIGNFFSALGTKVHLIFTAAGVLIGSFFSAIGTWAHDRVTAIGNFFSSLGTKVHNIFSQIGSFIGGIWNGMLNGAKNAVNSVINVINGIIDGINNISSKIGIPAIPHIPYLARGARNFIGGLAVVGEAGPELVHLPAGADVYSNADSASLLASNIGSDVSAQPVASVAPSRPQQASRMRDVTVVLEVNGKKFAKATIDDFGPEIAKEVRAVLR